MRLSIFLFLVMLISSAALRATISISNVTWSDVVDKDGDGYTATRTLNFSLSASEDSHSVRVQTFYTQMNGDVWVDGVQTDAFQVSSGAGVDKAIAIPPLMDNGVAIFKFRIKVVNSADPQEILASAEPEYGGPLYYQLFESVSYDDIFQGKPFIVTNAADNGPGSLREAITLAQSESPDNARILFNLAPTEAGHDAQRESWTIQLSSPLPPVKNMGSFTIDGFTQPYQTDHGMGYPIVVDGHSTANGSGLDLSDIQLLTIRGIQVLNFKEAAISVSSVNSGIIYNCILGTDLQSFPEVHSLYGLFLHNVANLEIGASGIWVGNSFVGNLDFALLVSFSSNISILANNFGTPAYLSSFLGPANIGVAIQAQNNSQDIKVKRNRFLDSGNVAVQFLSCGQSEITQNQVNVDSTWNDPFGSFRNGIRLSAKSDGNLVMNNTIGYCTETAILVDGQSVENRISQNGISRNGAGIELHDGGNNNMPTADLDSIDDSDVLHGLAGPGFQVEIFGDESDQARVYLGSTTVNDGMKFSFDLSSLPIFPNVTATVTDNNGNTGTISAPLSWRPDADKAKIVTNTNDSGQGSLRYALEAAQASGGPDSVRFNIPFSDPGYNAGRGVWTISPRSAYNISAHDIVIDGASQAAFVGADANPFGPEIVIDGHLAPNGYGFNFNQCQSIVVQNLAVTNFAESLSFFDSKDLKVAGCYLGTDYRGQTAGETSGVGLHAYLCRNLVIGGNKPSDGNLISGNTSRGVLLDSCITGRIENNRIGVDRTGREPLHNEFEAISLQLGSRDIVVSHNQVAGKKFGIRLIHASNTTIDNNTINTDSTFGKDLGDDAGILLQQRSTDNSITENNISFCQRAVVIADTSVRNTLSQNRITANDQAIILISGGNELLPAPILSSATESEVVGSAGPNQIIEVFADSAGQGELYLGSTMTDETGAFRLPFAGVPDRPNVTAIATDVNGNSSAFSSPVLLTGVDGSQFAAVPKKLYVSGGYPNPFNPQTVFVIELPRDEKLTATIYDIRGRRIRILINEKRQAGRFSVRWDGTNDVGLPVSSGVYLLNFRMENESIVRKLTLIR